MQFQKDPMDFSGLADACRAQGGGGGVGGVGGGKREGGAEGCLVDHRSRFNDRSPVAPWQGNSQQPVTVGKGPSLGSLQGPPAALQGPSGTLKGPSGTFQGPEETFEEAKVAMADFTLSRTPHSLKKVTDLDQKSPLHIPNFWNRCKF